MEIQRNQIWELAKHLLTLNKRKLKTRKLVIYRIDGCELIKRQVQKLEVVPRVFHNLFDAWQLERSGNEI